MCVVLINIGGKWFPNYLYQQWCSVILNIIGVPFSTFPANMYIRYSSLSSFHITPNYHPMFFKNIETQKPFSSVFLSHFSAFNKKTNELFCFITGYFLFNIEYRSSLLFAFIKKSAISHTYFLTNWIQWLTIIFWRIKSLNLIDFWYGCIKR